MKRISDIPERYRETELGELPQVWNIVKIKDVAQIQTGGNAPQGEQYFINGKYPFVRVQHFDGKSDFIERWDLINDPAIKDYHLKLFPPNAILFPKSGASIHLEKRGMLRNSAYVVSHLCIIISDENKVDNNYLFYLLKLMKFAQDSAGSTLPYLNLQLISNALIPLPPLPEQRAIAITLRTVQEAKEKTDAMIAATKALKAAMMKHLFTYGPVPPEEAERVILKDTEIGQMAEGWEIVKLEDIVRLKITDGVHKTPKYTETGVPFISAINMENDTLNFLNCRCISVEDHKKLIQRCHPEQNDSLLCKVGATIGKVAKIDVTFPFSIFVQIALIKPDLQKINPDFLKYSLISEKGQSQIFKNASQSTMPFIGTNKIGKILIPYPDIQIQEKIGKMLIAVDQKLATEQSRKEALDTLFTSLLHKLMTAKIRVKPV